jgi:transcriptional regulator with XRE-family HTH domain
MNQLHKELGSIIRDFRQKTGMSQLQLAHKLGYDSPQFVSLFERGVSKVPFNILGRLIVVLGIPEKRIVKLIIQAYEAEIKRQINSGKKAANR